MVDFLLANHFSVEAKVFAKEAKEALKDGGEVDFEDAYIETLTPDDSYIYNGPKQFIPKELSLSNGDIVSVLFGITHSDNKSADQKVATHLIDGLKEALGRANEALASADKIKEIYISATTNGNHGSTSNHFNGTAMDISRINGNKMALTGVTNQIKELQNAFDDYKYIRENFGPYFKHKFKIENNTWNYNYAVGGHKDHIHISTRK